MWRFPLLSIFLIQSVLTANASNSETESGGHAAEPIQLIHFWARILYDQPIFTGVEDLLKNPLPEEGPYQEPSYRKKVRCLLSSYLNQATLKPRSEEIEPLFRLFQQGLTDAVQAMSKEDPTLSSFYSGKRESLTKFLARYRRKRNLTQNHLAEIVRDGAILERWLIGDVLKKRLSLTYRPSELGLATLVNPETNGLSQFVPFKSEKDIKNLDFLLMDASSKYLYKVGNRVLARRGSNGEIEAFQRAMLIEWRSSIKNLDDVFANPEVLRILVLDVFESQIKLFKSYLSYVQRGTQQGPIGHMLVGLIEPEPSAKARLAQVADLYANLQVPPLEDHAELVWGLAKGPDRLLTVSALTGSDYIRRRDAQALSDKRPSLREFILSEEDPLGRVASWPEPSRGSFHSVEAATSLATPPPPKKIVETPAQGLQEPQPIPLDKSVAALNPGFRSVWSEHARAFRDCMRMFPQAFWKK